jgi:hypothetical protein
MWEAFHALIEKPEGKLTIAPQSDPRDAVNPQRISPEDAFRDIPVDVDTAQQSDATQQ